jgi:hypothetical protein
MAIFVAMLGYLARELTILAVGQLLHQNGPNEFRRYSGTARLFYTCGSGDDYPFQQ